MVNRILLWAAAATAGLSLFVFIQGYANGPVTGAGRLVNSNRVFFQEHAGYVKPGDLVYRGICDGSAAVVIAGDTLLTAYDELNTLFAFPLAGGRSTARFDLAKFLDLRTSDEIDIEAATVAGDLIWWIGSHSLDSGGHDAPGRRTLFATNIPAADLHDLQLLVPPQDLTGVLLDSPDVRAVLTQAARQRAPKQGGIDIEGLASSPGGGLLLGFRSPLTDDSGMSGDAMLVRLEPAGDSFRVHTVTLLDLNNRGIRDLVNYGDGYMMIAGAATAGYDRKFALYKWRGNAARARRMRRIKGLHAEALVDAGDHWLILSDDGKRQRAAGKSGDDHPTCDSIRRYSVAGEAHPGVYFRAQRINKKSLRATLARRDKQKQPASRKSPRYAGYHAQGW